MKHIVDIIDQPLSDDIAWGVATDQVRDACYQWPFGELLLAFYILAKENEIIWPLGIFEYRNLRLVLAAMDNVYKKLPPEDRDLIKGPYEWFLTVKIDWIGMRDNQQGDVIPTDVFIHAQEVIEETERNKQCGSKF